MFGVLGRAGGGGRFDHALRVLLDAILSSSATSVQNGWSVDRADTSGSLNLSFAYLMSSPIATIRSSVTGGVKGRRHKVRVRVSVGVQGQGRDSR